MTTRPTLHRNEDVDGVHEWVETLPAPRLGPWIDSYTGYREEVDARVQRLETPSSDAVLILSFGDPLTVSQPTITAPQAHPASIGVVTSFAGGITDRPALTTHTGRQHGIQVRLGPLAVYALFGVPLVEINQHAGGVIDLAALGVGDWGARLGAVDTWESRFVLLDDCLRPGLPNPSPNRRPRLPTPGAGCGPATGLPASANLSTSLA